MPDVPKIPRIPGGPDPEHPVPRDPVDGFDLQRYATVAAHLAARREPRKATLTRFGVDEPRWMNIEKTWLLRIAVAALGHDLTFGEEHDATFLAVRRALSENAGSGGRS